MSEEILKQILTEVKEIKSDVSDLKEDVSTIKSDVSNLQNDVTKMDERLSNMEFKQETVFRQTGKLTEYHADMMVSFGKLATKKDLKYFPKMRKRFVIT